MAFDDGDIAQDRTRTSASSDDMAFNSHSSSAPCCSLELAHTEGCRVDHRTGPHHRDLAASSANSGITLFLYDIARTRSLQIDPLPPVARAGGFVGVGVSKCPVRAVWRATYGLLLYISFWVTFHSLNLLFTAPTIHWRSVSGLFSSKTLPATAPAPAPVPARTPVINIDNSDSDTDTSPRAAPKADIIDSEEVAVGLTALQESLEPEDPAPHSFPSRSFNTGTSGVDLASPYFRDLLSDTPIEGAEQFQGFGSCQTVQEGTRKAWGTRNLASGLKKNHFLALLNKNVFINRFLGLEKM
ncbi:hypothetical protein GGX14DRAFT_606889 [Mycena pura]|uniref:Uncharacterized protein n=1 Tax=Mycena pura TaxID=153505 RepID=A0AAD6YEW6_9AGAR|nr:hypothetical protein GGX14DRAFT_606889 [Mycena pura]